MKSLSNLTRLILVICFILSGIASKAQCTANFNYQVDSISGNVQFTSASHDSALNNLWRFDNGPWFNGPPDVGSHFAPGTHTACHIVLGPGCADTVCKTVNMPTLISCKANFEFNTHYIADPLHLSDIIVEWKDENGINYSSVNVKQDAISNFMILESKEYAKNEKGQKTRLLKVSFSCTVSDGTHLLQLKNIEGSIAVAYH
jgi:hypothetical protein